MEFLYFVSVVIAYYSLTRVTKLPPYFFIIGIVTLSLVIYYPGIPENDTTLLYRYYTSGHYSDWQPPIYTIWWHIFHVHSAEFIMNTLIYYSGIIYLSYQLNKANRKWQNDLIILFSCVPLYMTQLMICLKDVPYTGFIILSICILYNLRNNLVKWQNITAMLTLYLLSFLAIGFKYNGMFAIFPILFYATYLLLSNIYKLNKAMKYLISFTLSMILVSTITYFNNLITFKVFKADHSYSSMLVMYNDLANIECATSQIIIPDKFFTNNNSRELMCDQFFINYRNYEPLTIENWSGTGNPAILKYGNTTDIEFQEIQHVWINALISHPIEYFQYRYKFLTTIVFSQWWWTPLNTNIENGFITTTMAQISVEERNNNILNGAFLIIGTLIALLIAIHNRTNKLPLIIMFSSLLQLLSLFLVLGVPAARFFIWNYIAIILAIALTEYNSQSPIIKKKVANIRKHKIK